MDPSRLALGLSILLVAAKLGGHAAVRLGQAAVLGEIVAGVALGNVPGLDALGWVKDDASIDVVATLGALILLFDVGLEHTVRDVMEVGRAATAVAVLGTVASFGFGWLAATALRPEASPATHAFVAAALTATSIGITARVMKDLGRTRTRESRVILGAAVIDDVLGLILLALVSGSIASADGHPSFATIGWTTGKAVAFFGVALVGGRRVTPLFFGAASRLRASGALVAMGLALCFFLAWVAGAIGLAPIVGAFTAGLLLEDTHSARFVARGERPLAELVAPLSSLLVPIFFVVMGARVSLGLFAHPGALVVAVALTFAAIAGKLACALGASGCRRLDVALGMMPRGEVTLVYATLGTTLQVGGAPVLDRTLYSALILVVLATTLMTPGALKWASRRGAVA